MSIQYLLTIVDEFSRFLFAFQSKDISSETVNCFSQLFSIFGMPETMYIMIELLFSYQRKPTPIYIQKALQHPVQVDIIEEEMVKLRN